MDITKDKDGKAHLTLTADPAWLADPARVYPVFIDPAIYPYYSGNPDGTLLRGDAYVSELYPTTNFGTPYNTYDSTYSRYHLALSRWISSGNTTRGLVGFDVRYHIHEMGYNSAYNRGADVSAATFKAHCYYTSSGNPMTVYLHRVNGDWAEDAVTWNNRPGTSLISSQSVSAGSWASFDATSLAQEWVRGEENGGARNRGFGLRRDESANGALRIDARESATYDPRLEMSYTSLGCLYSLDEAPTKFITGDTKACSVYVKNTGANIWYCSTSDPTNPMQLSYKISEWTGTKVGEGSIDLPRDVLPGETISISLPITAPTIANTYELSLSMQKKDQYLFDEKGVDPGEGNITVVAPAQLPTDAERTDSARLSGPSWMSHARMGGLAANLVTGNATASATDLAVSGRGAFSLARTYNSGAPSGQATLFGPGWFSNLDTKVKDYGNGWLAYWDSGGTSYLLCEAQKANLFVCPEGAYFRVEKNPDYTDPADTDDNKNWRYRVIGTSGGMQFFDGNGKLIYFAGPARADGGTGNYVNKTKIEYGKNFDGGAANDDILVTEASGRTFPIWVSGAKITQALEGVSWADEGGHDPRSVSYEYAGAGGRLSKVTLSPGGHWTAISYHSYNPKLVSQVETRLDTDLTRKSYYAYSDGKLTAYRDPRSTSSADNTYKTTITYGSGSTVVSSPSVSNYVGSPSINICAKYVFDSAGHTTGKYGGVNPDGTGGLSRSDTAWNACHQVTCTTDYSDLSTPLGSTSMLYDGRGNVTRLTDDLNSTEKATATTDYTASAIASNNPTQVTSPDGDKVSIEYGGGQSYFKTTEANDAQTVVLRDEATENSRLSVALPAPYINHITNPSMEKDNDYLSGVADGWTAEENLNPVGATDYQVYTVDPPDSAAAGRRVQRLEVQGNTNTGQMAIKQEVDLPGIMENDANITLAFSYRNSACANRELWLEYRVLDSGGSPVTARSVKLNPSLEWNRTSLTFEKSSPIDSIEVKLVMKVTETGQDAWAEFDAVQLFYGTRDTSFNSVENSSFRTWDGDCPTGWSIDNQNYLKPAYGFTPTELTFDGDNFATQTVKVKPNTRYLFFVRLLVQSAGEGEGARASCGGQYASEGSVRGYIGGSDYGIGDAGTPGVPDAPATAFKIIDSGDATTLEIKLELCAGDYTQATFYDVSLTEMPQDVTTSYDSRGNYANEVTAPNADGGYSTTYVTTDPVGNVRKARDARSDGPTDNTYCFTYSYNELSQLTSLVSPLVHDADGEDIQAYTADYDHYDKAGRLLWFLDNKGEETSYEYNPLGQVTEKTDALARQVQVEYNEVGGVKKVTYPDPDGPNNPLLSWEVYYAYRKNGTLDKVAFRDPQGNLTNPYAFTYDGAGRMTQVSDSATGITLNFSFDKASRLLSGSSSYAGGFTSTYAYTKAGRLTSLGYSKSGWGSGTQVTYAYRDTGEQASLTLPAGHGAISYAYDDQGRLSTLHNSVPTSPNVSYPTSLTYDAAGRVASVSSAFADSGSLTEYTYDAIGNVTCMVQGNIRNLYAYDELCRLTSWTEKTAGLITASEKYFYDGNGNLTAVDTLGGGETHAYDAANQCTDTGFTYDTCGNLTSDGEWAYAYERGTRLASATNDTQNIKLAFGYDPRGRRCSKCAYERDAQGQYTVQTYAVFYHYDAGGNVLAETDAAGNLIRSYAYDLSGHPVAMTQDLGAGQKTFFLHSNARGDVIYVTDENMNWAKRFTYDPWGRVT
ncbi:MAG: DNRLRE domain-containing protein [Actinomycetota bacterium]